MDRLVDVLDRVVAEILEHDVQLALDLPVGVAGEQDFAGLGQALHAHGNVHAIAVDVVFFDDDVAEVDAQPIEEAGALRQVGGPGGHRLLHGDGALHAVDDAGKLSVHAVPRRLDDPAAMLPDGRYEDAGDVGLDLAMGGGFVDPHQGAVIGRIDYENRRKPPNIPLLRHCLPAGRLEGANLARAILRRQPLGQNDAAEPRSRRRGVGRTIRARGPPVAGAPESIGRMA